MEANLLDRVVCVVEGWEERRACHLRKESDIAFDARCILGDIKLPILTIKP